MGTGRALELFAKWVLRGPADLKRRGRLLSCLKACICITNKPWVLHSSGFLWKGGTEVISYPSLPFPPLTLSTVKWSMRCTDDRVFLRFLFWRKGPQSKVFRGNRKTEINNAIFCETWIFLVNWRLFRPKAFLYHPCNFTRKKKSWRRFSQETSRHQYERKESKPEHVHVRMWCITPTEHLPRYNETLIWDEDESVLVWQWPLYREPC